MAYSSSEKIKLIEKEIALEKKRLDDVYKCLGENVAFFVKNKSFSYCVKELSDYEISRNKYFKLLKTKNNLKSRVEEIKDCKTDLFKLKEALLGKEKEESQELSKFGAAIYEAYTNNQLNENLSNKLNTVFDKVHLKMESVANKRDSSSIILFSAYHNKKLNKLQNVLFKLFIESAKIILDEKLEDQLSMKNKDKYLIDIYDIFNKKKSLEKNIKKCNEKIEELKKEDKDVPAQRLEDIQHDLKSLNDVQINAAIHLGKELYNNLPNEINSNEIGNKSISLIDEITFKLAKIESLEENIVKLNNEIFISELSAQIAHERSKIKQLEQQIDNCHSQIDKISGIINKKRDKIIELKKSGTYETSKINIKTLDE